MTADVTISELSTPSLVVDLEKLRINVAKAADHAETLNVTLRPHLKTPKSIEIARIVTARRTKGVSVSTLAEAAYFIKAGYDDVLYTTPLAPQKVPQIGSLRASGAQVVCVVDCLEAVDPIADAARRSSTQVDLLVELDVDGYRSGIRPASVNLHEMVDKIDRYPLRFRGLLVYAGASYHTPKEGRRALAARHCETLQAARIDLASRGHSCEIRSFGSSPAFMEASDLPGVTEVRGGIYVFQDLFQAGIGHCAIGDIALSVATAVISLQPHQNRFFIDAGGLALSKDRSTMGTAFDARYGLVMTGEGELIGNLVVETVHQEIGVVTSRDGGAINFRAFPVGTILRVLPNHADMTAAAYDHYNILERGRIVGRWHRQNGWQISDV